MDVALHDIPGRPVISIASAVTSGTVSRLKKEIVAVFTRSMVAEYVNGSPVPTQRLHSMNTNMPYDLSGFSSPYAYPLLGSRFITVHINNRSVAESTLVADALRDHSDLLCGSPTCIRVFASDIRCAVHLRWCSGHQGAFVANGDHTLELTLENLPGSTKLCELRRALIAHWTREGLRSPADLGLAVAFVAPRMNVLVSDSVHHVEDFVLPDDVMQRWDIDALRGNLPLVERVSSMTMQQQPNHIDVTIFLLRYQQQSIGSHRRFGDAPHLIPMPQADDDVGEEWPKTPNRWGAGHDEEEDDATPNSLRRVSHVVTCRIQPSLLPTLVSFACIPDKPTLVTGGNASPPPRLVEGNERAHLMLSSPQPRGVVSQQYQTGSSETRAADHKAAVETNSIDRDSSSPHRHHHKENAEKKNATGAGAGVGTSTVVDSGSPREALFARLAEHLKTMEHRSIGRNDGKEGGDVKSFINFEEDRPLQTVDKADHTAKPSKPFYVVGQSKRSSSRKTV